MTERASFDPSRYMTKVGGNDYLEVKWRLLWFRDLNPNGKIETELIHFASPLPHPETGEIAAYAVVKATITGEGGLVATGYAHETMGDFREFLEKAETKAIGRALIAAGFGTQFSNETDMPDPTVEWQKFQRWLKDDAKLSPADYASIVGQTANRFDTPQDAYRALIAKEPKYARQSGTPSGGK